MMFRSYIEKKHNQTKTIHQEFGNSWLHDSRNCCTYNTKKVRIARYYFHIEINYRSILRYTIRG